jgi:ubiquinone/menaquinone biosynthesis C-methylase UbiE
MATNTNYWSEFYDEHVKKYKGNNDSLYYFESKEHEENNRKIFGLLGDDHDAVILDAGCGVGEYLIPLSHKCKFIYGIDISNESIKECSGKLKEKNISNASVKVSSITEIPLDDNSVDKILCLGIFQCLDTPDIEIAVKEFKRIIKKDGVIIVSFLNGGSLHGISTNFLRFVRKMIKGEKKYSSQDIPYKKLKKIIEDEKGSMEIFHSAYFYPRLFPASLIRFISKRYYFERFLPKFLLKYGLSISVIIRF